MELNEIVEFSQIVARLKKVKRSGWISHVGVKDPESVADHSFMCTLLAMCIGDMEGYDVKKLMRMALLHDVQESVTGDYDQYAKEKIGSLQMKAIERKAIEEVLSLLPTKLKARYLSLWEEFENQATPEAMLVREIDKIEMVLQALEYEKEGYNPQKLNVFWNTVQGKIRNPTLLRFLELLVKSRQKEQSDR